MKTMLTATSAALFAGMISLAWPTEAHALGPIDLEVGAKVGYATNPDSANSFNSLGFGVGGRAGISFLGIYVGGNLMYYTGGSADFGVDKISQHALQYGVEAGYGFKIAILTLRPQVGVGNLHSFGTVTFPSGDSTSLAAYNNLYIEPGLTALISLGLVYVGADANLLVLPRADSADPVTGASTTKTETAFTVHGQVGVKF
jgi:hypothetical protein